MVAIFTGAGSGFERGSGNVIGAAGLLGSAAQGRGGDNLFLNASTGNLLISRQDEFLVGRGPDAALNRTYNSLGNFSDDNGDNWRQSFDRRVFGLTGTVNTSGSTVKRRSGDGSEITYSWDGAAYVATDGAGSYDKLTYSGSQWTWTDGDSRVTEVYAAYGSEWRLASQTDTSGNSLTFSYTGANLTRVTTADGGYTDITWSGSNITSLVTSSHGLGVTRTRYGYDGSNRLTSVTVDLTPEDGTVSDGKTYVTSYTYHGSTKLVATISQTDGSSIALTYDGSNRLATIAQTVTSGVTRTTTVTYGSGYTDVTDAAGQVTRLEYNADGSLKKVIAPPAQTGATAQTVQFAYNGNGDLTSVTDAAGQSTSYTYDSSGNILTATDRLGNVVTRTYGSKNELLTETRTGSDTSASAANHTTRYVYDNANRLVATVSAEGFVTRFAYNIYGERSSSNAMPGHYYDVSGLLASSAVTKAEIDNWYTAIADKSSIEIAKFTYDVRGNLVGEFSYGLASVNGGTQHTLGYSEVGYVYDQAGQLLSRTAAGRNPETFVYDGLGRTVASVDQAGTATTLVFNDAATTTTVTIAGDLVQTSTYNKAGELLSYQESGTGVTGGTATYAYDALGRVRTATDATGKVGYTLYDKVGRKVADVSSLGEITEYRYDARNRLVATVSYKSLLNTTQLVQAATPASTPDMSAMRPTADAADLWTWTVYDNEGRVVEAIDGDGSVTAYGYDASGRLIQTTGYVNKLNSTQIAGLKTILPTTPLLPTAHANDSIARVFYDKDGRAVGALDGNGYLTQTIYDKAGRVVQEIAYATASNPAHRATGTFQTLLTGAGTTASDRATRYVYDGQGLLRFTVNGLNQVVEHVYEIASGSNETHGQVRRTITYAGAIITPSSWTVAGVKAAITAQGLVNHANNRSSWAVYDAAGRIAYAIDATGAVVSYEYNSLGLVTKAVAFATTRSTTTLPDKATMDSWKSSNIGHAANRITRNYYNAAGELRFAIDGEGYVSETGYDAEGRAVSTTRWSGAVSATDGWTLANVVSAAKGSAVTTAMAYDHLGRVSTVTDALGTVTKNSYTATGLLAEVTVAHGTPDSSTTAYTYDAAGRVSSQIDGVGDVNALTEFTYDGLGNVLTVKRRNANPDTPTTYTYATTAYGYDKLGRLLTTTNALSGVVTQEYNAFGDNVRTIDERLNSTWRYFDGLGRVVSIRDAEDYVTETGYSVFGEVASVTRRYNRTASATNVIPVTTPHANDATTSFQYDKRGLVTRSTDALGNYEEYTLNAFGDRVTVRNKLGGITTNTFDRRGLLTLESTAIAAVYGSTIGTSTSTNVNKFEYDARGNLVKTTRAFGATENLATNYAYDGLNRLTSKTGVPVATGLAGATVTPTETYTYDKRGNLIETVDPTGARSLFFYDDLDRQVAKIDPRGAVTAYYYDAVGNLTSTRAYDTMVTLPSTPGGTVTLPGGTYRKTTNVYDDINRLSSTSVASQLTGAWNGSSYTTSVETLTTAFAYDAAGNLIKTTDANTNAVFSYYDKLGRKTAQVDQERHLTTWTHDAEGNVLSEWRYANKVTGAFTEATAPSTLPSLLGSGATDLNRITTFLYDLNGQRVAEVRYDVRSATIDAQGVVTEHFPTSSVLYYAYNALGQLTVRQEANGDTTNYTYDNAGRLIVEKRASFTDHAGATVSPTVRYFYDRLDQLTSTRQGAFDIVTGDRITTNGYTAGRLTASTDADGRIRTYHYDAAGRVVAESYARMLSAGYSVSEAVTSAYDGAGNLITQSFMRHNGASWVNTDAAGLAYDATRLRYNAHGELTGRGITAGTAAAAVYQEFYDYDAAGRVWRTNAGDGVLKFQVYDKVGNQSLTLTSAGADLSALTVSNFAASLTSSGDTSIANAVTTITVYDKRGMAVATREPDRQLSATGSAVTITRSRAYNAFGEAISETDARGYTTSFAYNTMGRLITKVSPQVSVTAENGAVSTVNPTEQYRYDISGRLIGTVDANGNLTSRLLLAGSGHGGSEALTAKEFHADGGVFQTLYDKFGDARILRNELYTGSNATQTDELYSYDGMGRVTAITRRGGALTEYYAYDGLGQRIQQWNSFQGSGLKALTDYDAQGRIISTVAIGGDTTTTSYVWNASLVTTGLGTFGGWTQTTTYANTRTSIEKADMFGHTVQTTNLGGHVTDLTYDTGGRLTASSGLEARSYSWLGTGLLASASTTIAGVTTTQSSTYDAAGNKLTEYQTRGSTVIQNATSTYDALGRLLSWAESGSAASITPAATLLYEYDANSNVRRAKAQYTPINPLTGAASTGGLVGAHDHWFRYDGMNRMVQAEGFLGGQSGGTPVYGDAARGIGTIRSGKTITYNAAGQRATVATTSDSLEWRGWKYPDGFGGWKYSDTPPQSWGGWNWQQTSMTYTGAVLETYVYAPDGQIAEVWIANETAAVTGGGYYVSATGALGASVLRADFDHDALGRVTGQSDYNASGGVVHSRSAIVYDTAGRVLSERSDTIQGNDTIRSDVTNTYGASGTLGYALGNVVTSAVKLWKNGNDGGSNGLPDTLTTNSYAWYGGAVLSGMTYKPDVGQSTTHTTTYTLGGSGVVLSASIADGRPRTVTYTNDVHGQTIRRDEADSLSTGDPHEIWYRFSEREMGHVTNDGSHYEDYASSIGRRRAVPGSGPFRFGEASGQSDVAFGRVYDAINSFSQGAAGGSLTAEGGETLSGLASRMWGDSALWYRLAEANGLSGDAMLVQGQRVNIPAGIVRSSNTASTFNPYDPAETLGNTNPTTPKPPKKNNCGVVGAVIMAVVAVAVVAILKVPITNLLQFGTTAPMGSAALTAAATTAGVAVPTTAAGAAALAGSGAMIGAGAISGIAGSLVSQGVGVATGIQNRFNWGGVAMAGLSGGIGGAGGFVNVGSKLASGAVNSVLGNVLAQGIGIATRLQNKFDFAGVAAAGIGSLAGSPIKGGGFGATLGRSTADGLASAATRSLITGTSFGDNIIAVLPSVIGNTIGGMIADGIAGNGRSASPTNKRFAGKSVEEIADLRIADAAKASGNSAVFLAEAQKNADLRSVFVQEARLIAAARDGGYSLNDPKALISASLSSGSTGSGGSGVPGDITVTGDRTFGDAVAQTLVEAQDTLNSYSEGTRDVIGFGLAVLRGGPVGAIGGYALNEAVSGALSATGLDQQVGKLVTLVGSTGFSILSTSSLNEELSAAQSDDGKSAGLLVEAGSTILGLSALRKIRPSHSTNGTGEADFNGYGPPRPGLDIPQGLTARAFDRISGKMRGAIDELGYGDDIFVMGSRAGGTARASSDLDFGIRVSPEKFDEIIASRFASARNSRAATRDISIRDGRIQAGEAGLSRLSKDIAADLGISRKQVQISIIRSGGPFDNGPQTPLSYRF